MKTPAPLQTDLKANTDARLQRNYNSPRLENRFLAQAPSALSYHQYTPPSWAKQTSTSSPCPALQPTGLSSTMATSSLTSSLLSSTMMSSLSSSSSLLSTKNTLLMKPSLHPPVSFSLTSSYSRNPLLSCSKMSTPSAALPVCSYPSPSMENKVGSNEKREMEDMLFPPERLLGSSEEPRQDARHESLEEDDQMLSSEMPVLDMDLDGDGDGEQTVARHEEFGVLEASEDEHLEELKEQKNNLLNMVCCSLVNKSCTPGQKDWDKKTSVWAIIKVLATEITTEDPEFLLKVAVYTRQELNIRITANFLLALAAHLPGSKSHLRRYFCAAVQLPSDWLEVTRIYSMCFSKSLPSCLKKALVDKFKQFSEYQLAKYNTRKHRCKHNKKIKKGKKISAAEWKKWGELVRVDNSILKKYLESQNRISKDKKQSEFNLKKMIKRLHVKAPAEYVMAILGKKYPSDLKAFSRSGLRGVWERERAGKRMKLKQPDTWECKLSQEGNKAATWEKLIDGKSLPFMAMLRNLRNMISVGISEKHHTKILNRLTSKNAVIQSRQFPFRFLSAYKVILELSKFAGGPAVEVPSSREILQGILKKLPKSKRFQKYSWETTARKRLRVTMSVPYVYRLFNAKRNLLKKANERLYTQELLNKYSCALEKAVQISCKYNIPPLPGRTLVICNVAIPEGRTWSGADDVCLPPESTDNIDENKLSASTREVAMLLCMMINYCSEDSQVMLHCYDGFQEFKMKSDILLDNVRQAMKQAELDRIVVFDYYSSENLMLDINNYRQDINRDAVVIYVLLGQMSPNETLKYKLNSNTVQLCGFSEQILKFVSERGSSRMLQRVEHMDRLYNIPPPQGRKTEPERAAEVIPLPATPKFRWKGVRVFISSTFRDMHAERDVLVRSVFPELRRRAAPHYLYLQEVELRWGVTEEESNRAVELCLSEVCRSQILLGILGERYGLVPPRPALPELPQYSWVNSAPDGLSITEMEIQQFQALFPDSAQSRMFFYFRSPHLASSVPVAWRTDFVAESKEAEAKMNSLKTWIRKNDFKVTENYPCEWGGVVDGKPYVKGLEDFGKAALEDLWDTLQQLFVEETDEDVASEIKEQEVHQDAQQRQFHGRAKLISMATEKVQECQQKGGILMVEGNPGEGKTVFMAALAQALKTSIKNKKAPLCDVISYSTDASQSACSTVPLLRCLVQWLRNRKDDVELPPNTSYKDLMTEFHLHLNDLNKEKPLALFVDGADRINDGQESSLQNTISKRKGAVSFPLGQLSLPDKKEIVQKQLVEFGKKLSDSAFNNQLQTLLMKKGSVSPLYLHLACEELKNYTSFEKMKDSLQSLPQSLGELVQHSLLRLQNEYCRAGLGWALATLAISSTGLRESSLYTILNMCNDLNSRGGLVTWQEVLHIARHPESRVPMAVFSQLARTLHSELVSTFHSEPSCLEVSPDGKLVAVGTGEGTIHFLHTETGQEVKSLLSSGDGISGCIFLGEELLATTSFDGQVEVWDIASGCRTAHMNAHSNSITGCDVWSVQKSTEVASFTNPSPLNCVNFDLEGQLVAVGCWDGAVRLWNWLEQKNITTLLGHQSSVRSLSFSPCSSILCSGCMSGEVRLWSVPTGACVGSYHAHRGSTQSLNFLQGGNLLLSAGHDSVVHVWSGGLGQTVAVLGEEKIPTLQKQKRTRRGNEDEANALCVAVASGYAAVGYHGDGVKMFNLKSGEKVWASEDLPVSMLCLMWMEDKETELLLSGGMDHRLRVWERQGENLVSIGSFGAQKGPILALAQNSTCVASASDDFTIALWLKNTLTSKPWIDPKAMCILRGHNGGVTCLAFSPNVTELLSGGKDQALMIWKVNASPPVLSQSISNCHGDWITGCAWTSSAVLSCSSDCKLRLWDIQTGRLLREILSSSSLSTLCLWEDYVMAGSTDGLLMVWKWESGVDITRIQAHKSRLNHCTVVFQSDLEKNLKPEDLMVASASEDGTVKLWHPLQVQHYNTLHGHSAEIQALVCKEAGLSEFLTVSVDRSLRSWSVTTAMETPRCQKGSVRAVCFLGTGELMVCGYDTGRLEIWHQNSMVYWKKVSDGSVCAVTGMPDDELATFLCVVIVKGTCGSTSLLICPPGLKEDRQAHTDKVSVLRLTENLIISASYDRTVKLWDRHTKKQLGMFVCGGPVKVLEVNPCDPKKFVCGDTQGQLYFLSWKG
ncbi:telomerase component 1 [Labeo rohita]|uniref:Telomerase component 1 n=1 Tax=Labeo rohita TaxID=84645 RepID=A0A498NPK7_LABRO|nr:telomerase component 1 [Labeo rohita]